MVPYKIIGHRLDNRGDLRGFEKTSLVGKLICFSSLGLGAWHDLDLRRDQRRDENCLACGGYFLVRHTFPPDVSSFALDVEKGNYFSHFSRHRACPDCRPVFCNDEIIGEIRLYALMNTEVWRLLVPFDLIENNLSRY